MSQAKSYKSANGTGVYGHDSNRTRSKRGNVILRKRNATADLKCCTKCKQQLLRAEFHQDRSTKDGLYRSCRKCNSKACELRQCDKCRKFKSGKEQFYAEDTICKDCIVATGKKKCGHCQQLKKLTEFHAGNALGGKRSICKICHRRDYTANDSHRRRKRVYGLLRADFEQLMLVQDGRCAICKQPETKKFQGKLLPLHVDHNHATGQVRGLLCADCNLGLGRFKDNENNLQEAINYVRRNSNRNT